LEKVENFHTCQQSPVLQVSQKPSEYRRTASGSKTKIPSQQVQKHANNFFTKAMRSSQAFTHARMRSCTTHHLHV
jgi:hypothetical protein